jgi:hypothetical protein
MNNWKVASERQPHSCIKQSRKEGLQKNPQRIEGRPLAIRAFPDPSPLMILMRIAVKNLL